MVPLSQLALRHEVPCPYLWQVPALQSPLVPHVEVACTMHISAGSGALFGTAEGTLVSIAAAEEVRQVHDGEKPEAEFREPEKVLANQKNAAE